jgi:EmrB/QacA subfamily drug resistance transporter
MIPVKPHRSATDTIADVPAICHIPAAPVTPAGKQIVLLIAILAGFITPFDGSAVNIALPAMGAEFHMDAISLSWIATAYLLAAALFLVPFGKIADIYGRKRIFLYGIAIFSSASLVMTMVPTTNLLIAVRVLQGFGGAMIFGTSIAILTSVFPPGERGKALGIYITAVYFGLTVGPFLGGVLTQYLGWRSIFFVNVPIGIAACLLILGKLDGEWAECVGERFDLVGSVIYAGALVALMYGFSIVPDPMGMILIAAGCAIGIVFALYEMRIPTPVLDMRLLTKNRVFAFSNLAALINYSATFAVTFLLSLDLQYTRGFPPEQAGLILILQPAVMAIVSPVAGRLSDRIDPQIVASAGMALTALGLFLLAFLGESTPLWYLLVCLAVLGIGFGLFSSPNTNAIMSAVEKRYYGVASGMNGTMRLVGQMLSMGVAMMLFAIFIGRVEITPAYYPQFITSMHYAFVFFTVLCVFGIAASLKRGKRQPVHEPGSRRFER